MIGQQPGDNNFHSFYQLLKGAPEGTLKKMGLSRQVESYRYLCQNNNKVQMPPKVSYLQGGDYQKVLIRRIWEWIDP